MKNYLEINPKTDCGGLTDESLVCFVPMPNVQEKNNVVEYDLVPYGTVKKGFTVFKKGDMIWAKITPCMQNGKSCIVDEMPTDVGFGSTEFHVVRKRTEDVYMPFIWSIFSNENVLRAAQAVFSGSAGQQRVSASFLETFPAVLPKYEVQVKMVANLENKLTRMREKLLRVSSLHSKTSEYLFDALNLDNVDYDDRVCCAVTLSTIMGDKTFSAQYYHPERMAALYALRSNSSIPVFRLSNVVSFCRDIVSSADNPNYLGLAGVESQTGELSGVREDASGQAFVYEKDDILYGKLRPYLNKVVVAESCGICSTEFHVMRVIDTSAVLPEYVAAILRSDLILSQTKHMMTGNTHPRISNDDVQNLYIPVPDITVQKQIVYELQKRRMEARRLKIEAEQEWQEARKQFEKELLGE
ncbi:MAG: restriction endonuclease subunit S [Clostridia bacterium]|nr:restriction endonuclease subunit S [Clostridia bacterium]